MNEIYRYRQIRCQGPNHKEDLIKGETKQRRGYSEVGNKQRPCQLRGQDGAKFLMIERSLLVSGQDFLEVMPYES
jgi:hypothetical protein